MERGRTQDSDQTRTRAEDPRTEDRVRARIVLSANLSRSNAVIARELCVSQDTVRDWRGRYAERGLEALTDRPRSGRPRTIIALQRAEVCALACQLPAETGVLLARWSCPDLAAELIAWHLVPTISASSVRRILVENPIKPWRYESWIFRRDPDFAAKATVILDLYQGLYQGLPLKLGDRIVCIDAKPSIQARERQHPSAPPGPGHPEMRVEHEYIRHGALALLAALDVQTGQVLADYPKSTGITEFMALIDKIMTKSRYRDAPRVFVIVDNGSDHRGNAAIKRLAEARPNAIMIHTPIHASWLNQVVRHEVA
ncbi:IS630 family transposase [Nocardia sp. CA-107356]|uniref:IS630 family transposase n=1 Tax=Nocardia sp. CA-107356 TaxID=3239972 RepID=UPI003D8CFAEC